MYGQIFEALEILQAEYTHRRDEEIQRIREENLKSPTYKLLTPKKKRRAIDTEKFKLLFPELYTEFVYIKAYDLEKIFGRRALFQAAVQLIGTEKLGPYEHINITEVRGKLTEDELKSCILYRETEGVPVVAKRY